MPGIAFMIGGPKGRDKGKEDDSMEDRPRTQGDREDSGDLVGRTRKRASEDILSAIKDDDAEALDRALESHYEACEGMGDD